MILIVPPLVETPFAEASSPLVPLRVSTFPPVANCTELLVRVPETISMVESALTLIPSPISRAALLASVPPFRITSPVTVPLPIRARMLVPRVRLLPESLSKVPIVRVSLSFDWILPSPAAVRFRVVIV